MCNIKILKTGRSQGQGYDIITRALTIIIKREYPWHNAIHRSVHEAGGCGITVSQAVHPGRQGQKKTLKWNYRPKENWQWEKKIPTPGGTGIQNIWNESEYNIIVQKNFKQNSPIYLLATFFQRCMKNS